MSGHPENVAGGRVFPEQPHILKKILSTVDKYTKMGIPKRFLDKYEIDLNRDHVLLKLPNGDVWTIGITDSPSTVWLEDGWRKFTNFYSIVVGQFILFRYDGNSVFYVVILQNGTACEIDYPIRDPEVPNTESHLCSLERTEKGEASGGNKDVFAERLGGDISSHCEDKLPDEVQQQCKTTTLENKTVLEQAEALKSQYPTFIAVMQPPYYHVLTIPAAFAKAYISKPAMFKLSVSDGRNWDLECSSDENLSICWIPFVQENSLKLGDVCAFELITTGSRPELKVTVFRGEPGEQLDKDNKEEGSGESTSSIKLESNTLQSTKTATKGIKKKSSPFQKASVFKSSYPFFVKLMQKTYVSLPYDLSIPVRFTREHFRIKPKSARLCMQDGKVWDVKWFTRGMLATQGFTWTSFVIDNHLVRGDACVFELIKKNDNDPELRVTVFRKSTDELESPPSSVSSKSTLKMRGDFIDINTNRRECTALERAHSFQCNHPFFIFTVNSSYLNGNMGLYVRQKFVREHLNTRMKSVSLQVRDRTEKWEVNCCHMSTRKGVIYLGWRQFAEDNNVKIGDVCIFALIDKVKVKPVMEVVIFRAGED